MAPVGIRPFLDYLLTWLGSEGVSHVVLCVGYKRTQIRRFVGNGSRWNLRVAYAIERELLGTGGALKNAEALLDDGDVFVLNGDTLLDVSLKELRDFHRRRKAWVTVAAVEAPEQNRYGTLRFGRAARITDFVEKGATRSRVRGRQIINGGVYVLRTRLLKTIQSQRPISLERQVFPQLAAKGLAYGYITDNFFVDIGVPKDFWRANAELPKRFGVSHSC